MSARQTREEKVKWHVNIESKESKVKRARERERVREEREQNEIHQAQIHILHTRNSQAEIG